MAKRTFEEIAKELMGVTEEYSAIILGAHESKTPLYADADARIKLESMKEQLDALAIPILELDDIKQSWVIERVTVMQDAVNSSLDALKRHTCEDCQKSTAKEVG